jgi:hypothetical protein
MNNTVLKTLRLLTLPMLALSASFSSLSAASKTPTVVVTTDTVSGTVTAAGTSPVYGVPGANLTLLLTNTTSATTVTSATGAYSFTFAKSAISSTGLTLDSIDNYYLNLADAFTLPSTGSAVVNFSLYPKMAVATASAIAPTVARVWTVANPLPVPVTFSYQLSSNSAVKGTFTVKGLSSVSFSTPTQASTNVLQVYVANVLVAMAGK